LSAPSPSHSSKPDRAQWRSILVRSIVMLLVLALLLFVPAGSIAWTRGWLFLAIFIAVSGPAILYLWRVNPEIFVARSRMFREGTKRWDRILLGFLLPAMIAIFPVAALDDGRFQWSRVPWWVVVTGYLLLLAGMTIMAWAQAVNRFFEPSVRIQAERGHHVIDSGPYAIVRHPGYIAGLLLFAGIALALGSWWALVPAGIAAIMLVLRTAWEDRTLQAELAGYAAYAQKVRFRLIPGVW
jgi:protein-S-isoprenylcysteine O-methyltransferase Ste14